jgi:hypothetical protein
VAVLGFLVLALVAGCGVVQAKDAMVVPDHVEMYLALDRTNPGIPDLDLVAVAGRDGDHVGRLLLETSLRRHPGQGHSSSTNVDVLTVTVKGYTFEKRTGTEESLIDDPVEARGTVNLSRMMTSEHLKLVIVLDGHPNSFAIRHADGIVYIRPIKAEKVKLSNSVGGNPRDGEGLGYMTAPFRQRLAGIMVLGAWALDSDLNERLRDYAHALGYVPLDERLPGYQQPLSDGGLLVFAPVGKTIPDRRQMVGRMDYHEQVAGKKAIDVALHPARNVSPYVILP